MLKPLTDLVKWVTDQFTGANFWSFILYSAGVYLTGAFTGLYIPGLNELIKKVHKIA